MKDKSMPGKITPLAVGSDQAPVIFFDGAVSCGIINEIVQIELAMQCRIPVKVNGKDEIHNRVMMTCHLRGSTKAMAQLVETIEKAMSIAPPVAPIKTAPIDRERKDAA
jgi:hypothetical protein